MTKEMLIEMLFEIGVWREGRGWDERQEATKRAGELVDILINTERFKAEQDGFDQAVVKMLHEGYRR